METNLKTINKLLYRKTNKTSSEFLWKTIQPTWSQGCTLDILNPHLLLALEDSALVIL